MSRDINNSDDWDLSEWDLEDIEDEDDLELEEYEDDEVPVEYPDEDIDIVESLDEEEIIRARTIKRRLARFAAWVALICFGVGFILPSGIQFARDVLQ